MTEIQDPFEEVSDFYLGVNDTEGIGESMVVVYAAGAFMQAYDKVHIVSMQSGSVVVGMVAAEFQDEISFVPAGSFALRNVDAINWDVTSAEEVDLLGDESRLYPPGVEETMAGGFDDDAFDIDL